MMSDALSLEDFFFGVEAEVDSDVAAATKSLSLESNSSRIKPGDVNLYSCM